MSRRLSFKHVVSYPPLYPFCSSQETSGIVMSSYLFLGSMAWAFIGTEEQEWETSSEPKTEFLNNDQEIVVCRSFEIVELEFRRITVISELYSVVVKQQLFVRISLMLLIIGRVVGRLCNCVCVRVQPCVVTPPFASSTPSWNAFYLTLISRIVVYILVCFGLEISWLILYFLCISVKIIVIIVCRGLRSHCNIMMRIWENTWNN